MGAGFIDVIDGYFTCEFTTLSRTGSPQTWPLAARLLPDGRFLLSTSIGLPQKAFNIRRNPKVSLLFSNPTGSGVAKPGAVLVQGDATAEDRIVTGGLPRRALHWPDLDFTRAPVELDLSEVRRVV